MSLPHPSRWDVRRLTSKITATNNVGIVCNELHPLLYSRFAPLVGQQIKRKDGAIMQKFAKLIPPYSDYKAHGCDCLYVQSSDYTFSVSVRVYATVEGVSDYAERGLYIGTLSDGILVDVCDKSRVADKMKTDYTLAEVVSAFENYERAYNAASEARNGLHFFA